VARDGLGRRNNPHDGRLDRVTRSRSVSLGGDPNPPLRRWSGSPPSTLLVGDSLSNATSAYPAIGDRAADPQTASGGSPRTWTGPSRAGGKRANRRRRYFRVFGPGRSGLKDVRQAKVRFVAERPQFSLHIQDAASAITFRRGIPATLWRNRERQSLMAVDTAQQLP
jgi:hypothetical protein